MKDRSAVTYLLLLVGTIFGCILVGSTVSAAYLLWLGVEDDFNPMHMHEYLSLSQVRIVLGINQFFSFLLPGWICLAWWGRNLRYEKYTEGWLPIVLMSLYFLSLPFFQWVYVWTMEVGPPEWWPFSREAVPVFLLKLVEDASAKGLLGNLIVIAILPAIGEEIVFRRLGIPIFQKWMGQDHAAVILSAFVFAFLHFDFEGLLARTVLGLVLGYAWYFSGRLWVPIMIHFVHNGGQVVMAYLYPETAKIDPNMEQAPPLIFAVLCALGLILVYWRLSKLRNSEA